MAKFGFDLKNKILRILFGIKPEIFDMIDYCKKDGVDVNFLSKYSIPDDKIKITIGYSGNEICNHISILNELEKIEQSIKDKMHLLLPMTYGNFSKEYLDKVLNKLKLTKISYTLFNIFLTLDELVKLRVTSKIMIMMNENDALSASVSEAIYAENLIISAVWLPYSPFRLAKIFFYETDFSQLSDIVSYAAKDYENIKINLVGNPDKVKKLTSFIHNYHEWIKIFAFF